MVSSDSSSSDCVEEPAAIALNIGCSPGAWVGTLATTCSSVLFFLRLLRRPPPPDSDLRPFDGAESTGSVCSRMPRPPQFEHDVEKASMRPVPNRLRVSWTKPSDVTSDT
ncbi:hypothetical protein MYSE111917_08785 [Mycobacterium senriense]